MQVLVLCMVVCGCMYNADETTTVDRVRDSRKETCERDQTRMPRAPTIDMYTSSITSSAVFFFSFMVLYIVFMLQYPEYQITKNIT